MLTQTEYYSYNVESLLVFFWLAFLMLSSVIPD